MGPFIAVKGGIKRAGRLGLVSRELRERGDVGKLVSFNLQTANCCECTVILEDSAVGHRGEDCGFQSVPQTLDESICSRRLISPETRAKYKI